MERHVWKIEGLKKELYDFSWLIWWRYPISGILLKWEHGYLINYILTIWTTILKWKRKFGVEGRVYWNKNSTPKISPPSSDAGRIWVNMWHYNTLPDQEIQSTLHSSQIKGLFPHHVKGTTRMKKRGELTPWVTINLFLCHEFYRGSPKFHWINKREIFSRISLTI